MVGEVLAAASTAVQPPLTGRRVAFTTPPVYAPRLARLLSLRGAAPLPLATVVTGPTEATLAALAHHLRPAGALDPFSSLALVSRSAISALAAALSLAGTPPLSPSGPVVTVAALGRDADLLHESGILPLLCSNPHRVRVLVPETATPAGLVASLGSGLGRRILCPVPEVVGLEDPPVVPDFLRDLEAAGWAPVRVAAYETRWAGPGCMEGLVEMDGSLDAIVFTSSAEVEGMLKGLERLGWDWKRVRVRWPELVAAAHGPVTAAGAERLGVIIDVVGTKFRSFDGVVDALASWWGGSNSQM